MSTVTETDVPLVTVSVWLMLIKLLFFCLIGVKNTGPASTGRALGSYMWLKTFARKFKV